MEERERERETGRTSERLRRTDQDQVCERVEVHEYQEARNKAANSLSQRRERRRGERERESARGTAKQRIKLGEGQSLSLQQR